MEWIIMTDITKIYAETPQSTFIMLFEGSSLSSSCTPQKWPETRRHQSWQ